ncbi:MAG: DNA-directed RNA polymerase subunit omega [Phycisphaerae bacterium]
MIDALRSDRIVEKVGGRFKLAALIQRRWLELMQGARPMVDPGDRTAMEVIIDEILQDKLSIDYEGSNLAKPGLPQSADA